MLVFALLKKHIVLLAAILVSAAGTALAGIWSGQQMALLLEALSKGISPALLTRGCSLMVLTTAAQAACTFLYTTFTGLLGENIAMDLRLRLFSAILHKNMDFFDANSVTDLLARLDSDIQDFKRTLKHVLTRGTRAGVQAATASVQMWLCNRNLFYGLAVVLPVIFGTGHLYAEHLKGLSKRVKASEDVVMKRIYEAIQNITTVKAFVGEEYELKQCLMQSKQNMSLYRRFVLCLGGFLSGAQVAFGSLATGALYFGGMDVLNARMSAGKLVSFLLSLETSQKALTDLVALNGQMAQCRAALDRIADIEADDPRVDFVNSMPEPLSGAIAIDNVSFTYRDRSILPILDGASMQVKANEVVAVIGASGAGKSTLMALLEKFYNVEAGAITIDGVDIRNLHAKSLRARIGYISQDPVLFSGSIRDNILYGLETDSEDELVRAAEAAHIHDFILTLKDGYDTMIQNTSLSGGQRQRIAIARVLVRQPQILILDEATSALDPASRQQVLAALQCAFQGRTVILITHDHEQLKLADKIFELKNGKLLRVK